jgi:hypothetical protein
MQQDAGANSSSYYQSLIQSLVNYVSVVGFEVVKQDVKAVNGEFQAYTYSNCLMPNLTKPYKVKETKRKPWK